MDILYLVLEAVTMEVCCVYVYFISHSHQVPVHLFSYIHTQPMKVAKDQAIYTYNGQVETVYCFSVIIKVFITSSFNLLIGIYKNQYNKINCGVWTMTVST